MRLDDEENRGLGEGDCCIQPAVPALIHSFRHSFHSLFVFQPDDGLWDSCACASLVIIRTRPRQRGIESGHFLCLWTGLGLKLGWTLWC